MLPNASGSRASKTKICNTSNACLLHHKGKDGRFPSRLHSPEELTPNITSEHFQGVNMKDGYTRCEYCGILVHISVLKMHLKNVHKKVKK